MGRADAESRCPRLTRFAIAAIASGGDGSDSDWLEARALRKKESGKKDSS